MKKKTHLCFFISEIPVELTPVVDEKEAPNIASRSVSTSCRYASELRKELLEYSSKRTIIKRIRCDDYDVLEGNKHDKHVTILCKFSKDSDLTSFENSFYNDHLAKTLETFFCTIGLQWRFGVSFGSKKEFTLRVSIERKYFMQKPSGAHISNRYVSHKILLIFFRHEVVR